MKIEYTALIFNEFTFCACRAIHLNFSFVRETLLLPCPVRVDRITPLLRNPGCIMVTDAR